MKRWILAVACCLYFSWLQAAPDGFKLVAGDALAPVQTGANAWTIQSGKNSIIEWNGFSIGADEALKFLQSSSSNAILNRVIGGSETALLGQLLSNGKVFVINPNGVLIGPNARIETASFIASTLDVLNEEFLKLKDMNFTGAGEGSVVNLGTISCPGGDIMLIAKTVSNQGDLQAPGGFVGMGVGTEILVKPEGTQRIFIQVADSVEPTVEGAALENSGTIQALAVEMRSGSTPYIKAIHTSGLIEATGVEERDGCIFLVAEEGMTHVENGTLIGDTVHVLGNMVGVLGNSTIDVSSENGTREILIGGSFQGSDPEIKNSIVTFVDKDVILKADAIRTGDGGTIVTWSDGATYNYGSMSARGGAESGNGGLVEVSGRQLSFKGLSDTRAPFGKTGTLLLDPTNIDIVAGGPDTGTFVGTTPAVFTPTVLQVSNTIDNATVTTSLASNNTVITTTAPSPETGDTSITVSSTIPDTPGGWTSNNTLTLQAASNITISASITNSGTNATGGVTLIAGGIAGFTSDVGINNANGITVNAAISTTSGDIFLQGTGSGTGIGVQNNSSITTSDTMTSGKITIYGTGVTGVNQLGVVGGTLTGTATKNIFIQGISNGTSGTSNVGVLFAGTTNIDDGTFPGDGLVVIGLGGGTVASGGTNNYGIQIQGSAFNIGSTNGATATFSGTGGNGTTGETGVFLSGTNTFTTNSMTNPSFVKFYNCHGGTGTGNSRGVQFASSPTFTVNSGTVELDFLTISGGLGGSSNYGVGLEAAISITNGTINFLNINGGNNVPNSAGTADFGIHVNANLSSDTSITFKGIRGGGFDGTSSSEEGIRFESGTTAAPTITGLDIFGGPGNGGNNGIDIQGGATIGDANTTTIYLSAGTLGSGNTGNERGMLIQGTISIADGTSSQGLTLIGVGGGKAADASSTNYGIDFETGATLNIGTTNGATANFSGKGGQGSGGSHKGINFAIGNVALTTTGTSTLNFFDCIGGTSTGSGSNVGIDLALNAPTFGTTTNFNFTNCHGGTSVSNGSNDGFRLSQALTVPAGSIVFTNITGGSVAGNNFGVNLATSLNAPSITATDIFGGAGDNGNYGFYVQNAATLTTTAGGSISITAGSLGTTGTNNDGIRIEGTVTFPDGGTLTLNGTGGGDGTTGGANKGIYFTTSGDPQSALNLTSTTTPTVVTLTGVGGNGTTTNSSIGVDFQPDLTLAGGMINAITFQNCRGGTSTSGTGNMGVQILPHTQSYGTTTNLNFTNCLGGVSTTGDSNFGVSLQDVTITGTGTVAFTKCAGGNGTGGSHHGVIIQNGGTPGAGLTASTITFQTITGGGTGGASQNQGVFLSGNTTLTATTSITGTDLFGGGGTGSGTNNNGFFMAGSNSATMTAPTISLTAGSLADGGSGNFGILLSQGTVTIPDTTGPGTGILYLNGTGGSNGTAGNTGISISGDLSLGSGTAGATAILTGIGGLNSSSSSGVQFTPTTFTFTGASTLQFLHCTGGTGRTGAGNGVNYSATATFASTGTRTLKFTNCAAGIGNIGTGVSFGGSFDILSTDGTGVIEFTDISGGGGTGSAGDIGINITGTLTTQSGSITIRDVSGGSDATGSNNSGVVLSGTLAAPTILATGIQSGLGTAADFGFDINGGQLGSVTTPNPVTSTSITIEAESLGTGTNGGNETGIRVITTGATITISSGGAGLFLKGTGSQRATAGGGNSGISYSAGKLVIEAGATSTLTGIGGTGANGTGVVFTPNDTPSLDLSGAGTHTLNFSYCHGGIDTTNGTSDNIGVIYNPATTSYTNADIVNITFDHISGGTVQTGQGLTTNYGVQLQSGGAGIAIPAGTVGHVTFSNITGGVNGSQCYGVFVQNHINLTEPNGTILFQNIRGGSGDGNSNVGVKFGDTGANKTVTATSIIMSDITSGNTSSSQGIVQEAHCILGTATNPITTTLTIETESFGTGVSCYGLLSQGTINMGSSATGNFSIKGIAGGTDDTNIGLYFLSSTLTIGDSSPVFITGQGGPGNDTTGQNDGVEFLPTTFTMGNNSSLTFRDCIGGGVNGSPGSSNRGVLYNASGTISYGSGVSLNFLNCRGGFGNNGGGTTNHHGVQFASLGVNPLPNGNITFNHITGGSGTGTTSSRNRGVEVDGSIVITTGSLTFSDLVGGNVGSQNDGLFIGTSATVSAGTTLIMQDCVGGGSGTDTLSTGIHVDGTVVGPVLIADGILGGQGTGGSNYGFYLSSNGTFGDTTTTTLLYVSAKARGTPVAGVETGSLNVGIWLDNLSGTTPVMQIADGGNMYLNGVGGDGSAADDSNIGIRYGGSLIVGSTAAGTTQATLSGTGGTGSSSANAQNVGVAISNGKITMIGTSTLNFLNCIGGRDAIGATGSGNNFGASLQLAGTQVFDATHTNTLNFTNCIGGSGSGGGNIGVKFGGGASVNIPVGSVNFTNIAGGQQGGSNIGVHFNQSGVTFKVTSGSINFSNVAGGSGGTNNNGVDIAVTNIVTAPQIIAKDIYGGAGVDNNYGFYVEGPATLGSTTSPVTDTIVIQAGSLGRGLTNHGINFSGGLKVGSGASPTTPNTVTLVGSGGGDPVSDPTGTHNSGVVFNGTTTTGNNVTFNASGRGGYGDHGQHVGVEFNGTYVLGNNVIFNLFDCIGGVGADPTMAIGGSNIGLTSVNPTFTTPGTPITFNVFDCAGGYLGESNSGVTFSGFTFSANDFTFNIFNVEGGNSGDRTTPTGSNNLGLSLNAVTITGTNDTLNISNVTGGGFSSNNIGVSFSGSVTVSGTNASIHVNNISGGGGTSSSASNYGAQLAGSTLSAPTMIMRNIQGGEGQTNNIGFFMPSGTLGGATTTILILEAQGGGGQSTSQGTNFGIQQAGGTIRIADGGTLSLTGIGGGTTDITGAANTGSDNKGFFTQGVITTGTGSTVSITGVGGSGSARNMGVDFRTSTFNFGATTTVTFKNCIGGGTSTSGTATTNYGVNYVPGNPSYGSGITLTFADCIGGLGNNSGATNHHGVLFNPGATFANATVNFNNIIGGSGTGTGGTPTPSTTTGNVGLQINGTTTVTAGSITFNGIMGGDGGTGGSGNYGMDIQAAVTAPTLIADGIIGGLGTGGFNYGFHVNQAFGNSSTTNLSIVAKARGTVVGGVETGSNNKGIVVEAGATPTIQIGNAGTFSLLGIGGNGSTGDTANLGIDYEGRFLLGSNTVPATISGIGGSGTSGAHSGVFFGPSTFTMTGTGTLTFINCIGGSDSSSGGLQFNSNTAAPTFGTNSTLNFTNCFGGTTGTSAANNLGVTVSGSNQITIPTGAMNFTNIGGGGTSGGTGSNFGIQINMTGATPRLQVTSGTINFSHVSGGNSGTNNMGIQHSAGTVTAPKIIAQNIVGGAGTDTNVGFATNGTIGTLTAPVTTDIYISASSLGSGSTNYGVRTTGTIQVDGGGTGLTIIGTGGGLLSTGSPGGGNSNNGIRIQGGTIALGNTSGATATFTGIGGYGTGGSNFGVDYNTAPTFTLASTNNTVQFVNCVGGFTDGSGSGIGVSFSANLSLGGTGTSLLFTNVAGGVSTALGDNNHGILVNSTRTVTAPTIIAKGISGGPVAGSNHGIFVQGTIGQTGSASTIYLEAVSMGSGSGNNGILVSGAVSNGGAGTTTLIGVGGPGSDQASRGVTITGTVNALSTASISITGTAGATSPAGTPAAIEIAGGSVSTVGGNITLNTGTNTTSPTTANPGVIGLGFTNTTATVTTSTGNINFNGPVLLESTTSPTITNTGGTGAIVFNGTVDSSGAAHPLTVSAATTGTVTFNRNVGSTNPLSLLTVSANTITQNGNVITNASGTGNVTYTGALNLGGNITTANSNISVTGATTLTAPSILTSTGGNISFLTSASTITGPFDLTLAASTGAITLAGTVSNLGDLTFSSVSTLTANVSISASSITQLAGSVASNFDLMSTTGSGGINLTGTLFNFRNDITSTNGGSFQVVSGASVLTKTAPTTTTIDTSNTGSRSGNIFFGGTLNGTTDNNQPLTLNVGTGTVTFGGAVGGTHPLGKLTITGTVAGSGSLLVLSGNITASEFVDAMPILVNGNRTITTNTTDITINNSIDGFNAGEVDQLTLTSATSISVLGTIGGIVPLGALTLSASGTAPAITLASIGTPLTEGVGLGLTINNSNLLNGAIYNITGGDANFGPSTKLGTTPTFKNGTNSLIFNTINATTSGVEGLTIQSVGGTFQINGVTGGTIPLGPITVVNAGAISINNNLSSSSFITLNPIASGIAFSGDVTISGRDGILLNSGSPISFSGTHTISTTAGPGPITIVNGGSFTLPSTITTNVGTNFFQTGGGSVSLGSSITTTNGDIHFTNAVTLTASPTLTTGGSGNIIFNGTLNGAGQSPTLTAGTGNIVFGGTVGNAGRLGALSLTSASEVLIGANVTVSSFSSTPPATISGSPTIDSTGALSFLSTIDSPVGGPAATLTLTGTAAVSATGVIGGTSPLAALNLTAGATSFALGQVGKATSAGITGGLTVAAVPTTLSGATYNTGTAQSYAGAVTLTASPKFITNGASGSNVTFSSTIASSPTATPPNANAQGFSVNAGASGNVTFSGVIGPAANNKVGEIVVDANNVTVTGGAGNRINTTTLKGSFVVNNSGTLQIGSAGNPANLNLAGEFLQIGNGPVSINGLIITESGDPTFNSPVTLTGDTTMGTPGINADYLFNSTVNSDGTPRSLTIISGTGTITFNGTVGGTSRLNVLTLTGTNAGSGSMLFLNADITANQVVDALPVTVAGGTRTITTTGGGTSIALNSTVNGNGGVDSLTLNAGTTASIADTIGEELPLQDLSITSTAITLGSIGSATAVGLNGTLTLSTDTTLEGSVYNFGAAQTLANNLTIGSLGSAMTPTIIAPAGGITLNGTINANNAGIQGLTIDSAGPVTLGGVVGGGTPLGPITLNGTTVSTSAITTSGQNGFLIIDNSGALTVGGAQNLGGSFLQIGSGAVSITTPTITTGLDAVFTGAVTLNAGTTTVDTSSGNGQILFSSTVTGASAGTNNLTLVAGNGIITFNNTIGATQLGALTLSSGSQAYFGSTSINVTSFTCNPNLVLTQDFTLSTTGDIFFGRYIDDNVSGAHDLILSSSGGDISFTGPIGSFTPVATVSATVSGMGSTIQIGSASEKANITSVGSIALSATNGNIDLLNNSAMTSGSGGITFTGPVTGGGFNLGLAAGTGGVSFSSTVGSMGSPLGAIGITGTALDLGVGTVSGDIFASAFSYLSNATTTLHTNVGITTSAASGIFFVGNIRAATAGTQSLTLTAGTGAISLGPIGNVARVNAFSIVSASQAALGNSTGGGGITANSVSVSAPAIIGAATVVSTTLGTTIAFNSTINGDFALTLNAGTGITLGGVVGGSAPVAGLTLTSVASTPITISNDIYTNNATLQFSLPVNLTLGSTVRMDTGPIGGDIIFDQPLNGAANLILDSGANQTTFNALVGNSTPLASLTVKRAAGVVAALAISAGSLTNTNIFNTPIPGIASYNGPLNISGDIDISSQQISFGSTVTTTAGGLISLVHTDSLTMPAALVSSADLFQESGGGSVVLNGPVTAVAGITFNSPVTLNAAITLTSTPTSTIINNTVNGAQNLTIIAGTTATFSAAAAVGATTPPTALSITAPSGISVGANQTVAGVMTYTGPVTLTEPVTFNNTSSTTSFSSTVTSSGFSFTTLSVGTITVGGNITTTGGTNGGTVTLISSGGSVGVQNITTSAPGIAGNILLQADRNSSPDLTFGTVPDGKIIFGTGASIALTASGATNGNIYLAPYGRAALPGVATIINPIANGGGENLTLTGGLVSVGPNESMTIFGTITVNATEYTGFSDVDALNGITVTSGSPSGPTNPTNYFISRPPANIYSSSMAGLVSSPTTHLLSNATTMSPASITPSTANVGTTAISPADLQFNGTVLNFDSASGPPVPPTPIPTPTPTPSPSSNEGALFRTLFAFVFASQEELNLIVPLLFPSTLTNGFSYYWPYNANGFCCEDYKYNERLTPYWAQHCAPCTPDCICPEERAVQFYPFQVETDIY